MYCHNTMTLQRRTKSGRKRGGTELVNPDDHDDHQSEQTSNSGSSTPSSNYDTGSNASTRNTSKLTTWDEKTFEKDTAVLQSYVKEELYFGVKFIYDPRSDLDTSQAIFEHFYKTCKGRLEGLKKYPGQEEKELYIRHLWNNATKERVQQDALSVKRSSVYTVMQNRFFCESVDVLGGSFHGLCLLTSSHYCLHCIYRFV